MTDNNGIVKFPIKGSERWKNSLGKRAVPCLVSGRWLRFPETSGLQSGSNYMFVDVMTTPEFGVHRKLCSICISKEDIISAIASVE